MKIKHTLSELKKGDLLRVPYGRVIHTYLVLCDNIKSDRMVRVFDVDTGETETLPLWSGYLQQAKVIKLKP